jgi:inhibitor of cysteine peptidase
MQLTDNDNGRSIIISGSDELRIILEANPTTGYRWQLSELDSTILVPGPQQFLPASGAIGSGGKEMLLFTAGHPGKTELKLLYRRAFERGKPTVKEFAVSVTVNDK